jgi:hypothetical protein
VSTALELVYQYRFLRGKCEAGRGLTVDEIDALAAIEALFSSRLDPAEPYFEGRQHAREKADLPAQLRNRTLADKVRIVELSPSGMVVAQAPFVDEGVTLEIVVDDREVGLSYRFRARVAWRRDDGDEDYVLGLELLGTPVLMRFRASTDDGEQQQAFDAATTSKFDKVAA